MVSVTAVGSAIPLIDLGPATPLLRVHREPLTYVNESQVHHALTAAPAEYLRHFEDTLRAVASGEARVSLPSKAIFPDGPELGDFRVMPCVLTRGERVTKTVKIVGTNVTEVHVPDQITVGKAVALHPHDNYISHIYEACLLSSARTGACVATAARNLAPLRKRIAMIGCGRVSFYACLYLLSLGGVEELVVHDQSRARAAAFAEWAGAAFPRVRVDIGAARDRISADLVTVCTTSRTPLLAPETVDARLVISVGADTIEQRELTSSWAAGHDVYCDVPDSMKVGDLYWWAREGAIQPDAVTDLLGVLRNGPRNTGRDRVFISTGSALSDNATIDYLQRYCGL